MTKKKEPEYIEVAKKKLEQSIETLTSLLGLLVFQTDFKNEIQIKQRLDTILSFSKRSNNSFNELKDEMQAQGRHEEAEKLGECWEKQLNPYARGTLVAMGYKYLEK